MPPTLLAIDCGTQSLRALLFDLGGSLLESVKIPYSPYYCEQPGWAEQDPEVFWDSLVKACRQLGSQNGPAFQAVAGLGVTAQRDSMVCLDRRGAALRPVITWLDQRKATPVYRPRGAAALLFRSIGMHSALMKSQCDGKSNWIRQNQPELWDRCHKYVQVSGFLNYRLTGEFADSKASQIGHIPINYKKREWAKPGALNAKLFPVEPEKLPELAEPGTVIGTVHRQAAEATGLPAGLRVVACGSDKGCETLGMGVIDQSMASLSFGTTATVQTTARRYFEPVRFMPAYPAPLPGSWNPEVEIFRGFWMIRWFQEQFGYREVVESQHCGRSPEELLDELLKTVPAGSMGLLVQPYWSPGLKHPMAKGAMVGFGDVHDRAYVYRAMIEGLSYALREGLHSLESRGKVKIKQAAVSGGASRSDEICRISADIFGVPIVRGNTWETSGLGAALITAVGLGLHPDFESAVAQMVHYHETFYPDPKHRELYDRLFAIYKKIYPTMQQLYREIGVAVGYPDPVLELL
ncbi:MAG: FGGY-family carbohydrate kinase [Spirochaetota bacterium]